MTLSEYAARDALGLAELVRSRQVSPRELREAPFARSTQSALPGSS